MSVIQKELRFKNNNNNKDNASLALPFDVSYRNILVQSRVELSRVFLLTQPRSYKK